MGLDETQPIYDGIFTNDEGESCGGYPSDDNTYFDFANPRSYNPNKEILLSAGDVVTFGSGWSTVVTVFIYNTRYITHINGEAVGDRAIITQAMLNGEVTNKVSPNEDDKLCTYMGLIGLLYENGISLNLSTKDGFGIVSTRHAVFKCSEKWVTLSGVAEFLTVGQIKEFVAEYGRGTLEPKQLPKEQPKTVPTTADNILEVLAYNGWCKQEGCCIYAHAEHKNSSVCAKDGVGNYRANDASSSISTPNFDLFMAFLTSIVPLKELPTKVDYLSAVQSGWWVKATKTVASCGVTAGTYYQIMHMHQVDRYVELIDSNWNVACMGYDFFDWSTAVADKPSEVAQ